MADKKSGNLIVPSQGGMLRDFVTRLKLITRLMGDRRVNFFLKAIPIGALIYLFSPIDLIPNVALPVIGVLDDAAVLWIGSTLFVELCPPDVVKEHTKALASNLDTANDDDEVVDSEATDINDDAK